ncbi:acyl-CoA thioesterase YciA [Candidatus Kinetoplastibacterium desouzaii TCC079E]|uniref:Acyl-CoA thioesterase YciA n=1 Tax=Candidatus Kinetoplastidibacterium desouzai TCC079E TaxID=1208919 RepID=M1L1M9_9PROT|nr:acyl-CoA thioesterase [Candidatus Kinetoplastibacterium desouzaii]AGF46668.1 acyl-CoA thioesterase YciA [Candidatus Kinetoplastibacterium desouzaii TCC079E]
MIKIHNENINCNNLILKLMPMPSDANVNGDVFGGWIMSQIDLAGSVVATKISIGRVATVAINSLQFTSPIKIGDLVSIFANTMKTGKTSITISIDVYKETRPFNGDLIKAAEAVLTFVATDINGKSRILPSNLE